MTNSLTVAEGLEDRMWVRGISGGLSVMIVAQYLSLWDWLEHIQLQKGEEDKVVWKWSENGIYSAKTAYRALHLGSRCESRSSYGLLTGVGFGPRIGGEGTTWMLGTFVGFATSDLKLASTCWSIADS